MSTDEELQRDVTRTALRALHGTQFALAGSGAIREHGIIDRPIQDIDLFTSDLDPSHFDTAVRSVVDELRLSGHMVFNKLDYSTSGMEIRPPSTWSETAGRADRPPTQEGRRNEYESLQR